MDRMDLVLVEFIPDGKRYLYRAPALSPLCAGDEVVLEDTKDVGKVVDVLFIAGTHDVGKVTFAMRATNATHPLKKVLSRIQYQTLRYEEELNYVL